MIIKDGLIIENCTSGKKGGGICIEEVNIVGSCIINKVTFKDCKSNT
jgi:hypothetical protein